MVKTADKTKRVGVLKAFAWYNDPNNTANVIRNNRQHEKRPRSPGSEDMLPQSHGLNIMKAV